MVKMCGCYRKQFGTRSRIQFMLLFVVLKAYRICPSEGKMLTRSRGLDFQLRGAPPFLFYINKDI